jgi:hypothetical protein
LLADFSSFVNAISVSILIFKVRLNGEAKGTTGNLIHTGGWAVVHPDNSCTIDLFDAFEKSEVNSDTLLDHVLAPPSEDLTGKYIDKIRRKAQSSISGAL